MPVLRAGRWRPVLDLTREETRELCVRLGLKFVEDPTNQLREHLRVRLREEVLPLLRQQNPQVEAAALAMTRRLVDADALVDAVVDAEFEARKSGGEDGQTLDLVGYAELNRELRTRLILRVLRRSDDEPADGLRRIVEDVDRALCADARAGRGFAPRRWDAGAGRELWVARGRLGLDSRGAGAK